MDPFDAVADEEDADAIRSFSEAVGGPARQRLRRRFRTGRGLTTTGVRSRANEADQMSRSVRARVTVFIVDLS